MGAVMEATLRDGSPAPVTAWLAGKFAGALLRVALYGFLIARPGVPFLPQENSSVVVLTVGAAVATSLPLHKWRKGFALGMAALAVLIVFAVLRMDGPTTSIVLIGLLVNAVGQAADAFPSVYGAIAAGVVAAIALQVFEPSFMASDQLLLSHEPWTADRAGHQMLLVAGLLFLAALGHLMRYEMERFKTQAQDAALARDAAVVDERARIARELHDVVSHHVTAMTLQAEAAAMTGDKQALSSVANAGREALTELRRMLGVLRHVPNADGENTDMEPQPDLAHLDRLAERTTAGIGVRVQRKGDVRPLPAGVELCVYRLVQEALTNSAKHGDATKVDVVLSYAPDMITVDIRDNGKPLAAPRVRSGGLGLIGMQERVALLNGELSTGPRSDGSGYEVVARLPIAS